MLPCSITAGGSSQVRCSGSWHTEMWARAWVEGNDRAQSLVGVPHADDELLRCAATDLSICDEYISRFCESLVDSI